MNKKNKILWISNYLESSGYSSASREYLRAMKFVGLDVVARPLFLGGNRCTDIHPDIIELQNKSADNCNIVVMHTLPHLIESNNYYDRNICLFASETSSFTDSNWPKFLSLMDQLWVINSSQVEACYNSGVKKPIKVIPHAFDANKLANRSTVNLPCNEDDVIFYCIADYTRRKNLPALLKAFHSEFDRTENVQLLLKLNKSGVGPDDLRQEVGKMLNEIKGGLKLYSNLTDYKQELVLTDNLSDEQLIALHNSADICVSSSFGEAWGLPLFDAAALGNYVISTDEGGPRDYLTNHQYGELVKANKDICFGFNDSFSNLYTARETVNSINILDLRKAMRNAFNLVKENKKLKNYEAGIKLAQKYSYKAIGELIKKILN